MVRFTAACVPDRGRAIGVALIPLLVAIAALSCGKRSVEDDPGPGSEPTELTQLSIEGPTFVELGATANFKALLRNSAGRLMRDVTQEALWFSSEPRVLAIDRGRAIGLWPGFVSLQVRLDRQMTSLGVDVDFVKNENALPAALVIERLSVTVSGPNAAGVFGYLPRFLLKETSGNSGATILEVRVVVPGSVETTGPGCWRERLTVPPGPTLDTFYTDEGLMWLGYCAAGGLGQTANPDIRVVVTFIDDGGRAGTVEAATTGTK